MKHLYPTTNLKNLLTFSPEVPNYKKEELSRENLKDYFLLNTLSAIENNDEPSNNVIEFLLNYSKSLDVISTNNGINSCVFNKN